VPVAVGGSGTDLGVTTAVGNALAAAIVGALASPLKLVSAVASVGGRVESITPEPILFLAGRSELAADQSARVEQLAGLLASSPALRLDLEGVCAAEDERWLAEQALLRQLESEGGLTALRNLRERGERNAVLAYLRARAEGGSTDLDARQGAWLEAKLAARTLEPAACHALALARAEALAKLLVEEHGVAPERVAARAGEPGTAAQPSVVVGFGAVDAPAPSAEAAARS
jgi:hypothetical protein